MNTSRSILVCLALLGCSESRGDTLVYLDASPDQSADASSPDVTSPDVSSPDVARPDVSSPDARTDDAATPTDATATDSGASAQLVINEISAAGDEWVELFNAGSAPVDLGGVQIADTDTDGGPRTSRAMRFPAGTMLSPGQYVLVLANQSDAGAGPQTRCLDGGPTTCFHASWSLSASRGETVYVLSSTGAETLRELYPMNATAAGQTWGRLPNGTGSFAVNRPTPGAINAAP